MEVTASSVRENNPVRFGPRFAMDGRQSFELEGCFVSGLDQMGQWLQVINFCNPLLSFLQSIPNKTEDTIAI